MRCWGRVTSLFRSGAGSALSVRRAPRRLPRDLAVGEPCLSQSSRSSDSPPWACPSQRCPHPKASCGRNLKAQPLGPSLAPPSASLPCSPVLRGCTLAPGPQALQTFSPGEVWGPVGCTHTALMGTRQVSHPGLGSLQAYSSSEPQPQACWWRPPSPSLASREPLLSQHLTT